MKFLRISLVIWLVVDLSVNSVNSKRDFTIELMKLNVNVTNANYAKGLNYKIHGRKMLTVELTLLKNLTEFVMKLNFDVVKKNNKRLTLAKLDINGCEGLKDMKKQMFFKTLVRELIRSGNIPKQCPIYADKGYYVRNYTVDAEDYPPNAPPMEYWLRLDMIGNKVHFFTLALNGRVNR